GEWRSGAQPDATQADHDDPAWRRRAHPAEIAGLRDPGRMDQGGNAATAARRRAPADAGSLSRASLAPARRRAADPRARPLFGRAYGGRDTLGQVRHERWHGRD